MFLIIIPYNNNTLISIVGKNQLIFQNAFIYKGFRAKKNTTTETDLAGTETDLENKVKQI